MKTFLFKTTSTPTKYGHKVVNKVYEVKRNTPIYIGEREYNTGGFRGHDHEAMQVIIDNKKLPKNCQDGSITGYINYSKQGKVFQLIQM